MGCRFMESKKELSLDRLKRATDSLSSAKILLKNKQYLGAANRAYYCVFYCINSVFALEPISFKKHSATISHFHKDYIKQSKFGDDSKRLSNIITDLFEVRGSSDYEDFFDISRQEVLEHVENAEFFLKVIKNFLASQNIKA